LIEIWEWIRMNWPVGFKNAILPRLFLLSLVLIPGLLLTACTQKSSGETTQAQPIENPTPTQVERELDEYGELEAIWASDDAGRVPGTSQSFEGCANIRHRANCVPIRLRGHKRFDNKCIFTNDACRDIDDATRQKIEVEVNRIVGVASNAKKTITCELASAKSGAESGAAAQGAVNVCDQPTFWEKLTVGIGRLQCRLASNGQCLGFPELTLTATPRNVFTHCVHALADSSNCLVHSKLRNDFGDWLECAAEEKSLKPRCVDRTLSMKAPTLCVMRPEKTKSGEPVCEGSDARCHWNGGKNPPRCEGKNTGNYASCTVANATLLAIFRSSARQTADYESFERGCQGAFDANGASSLGCVFTQLSADPGCHDGGWVEEPIKISCKHRRNLEDLCDFERNGDCKVNLANHCDNSSDKCALRPYYNCRGQGKGPLVFCEKKKDEQKCEEKLFSGCAEVQHYLERPLFVYLHGEELRLACNSAHAPAPGACEQAHRAHAGGTGSFRCIKKVSGTGGPADSSHGTAQAEAEPGPKMAEKHPPKREEGIGKGAGHGGGFPGGGQVFPSEMGEEGRLPELRPLSSYHTYASCRDGSDDAVKGVHVEPAVGPIDYSNIREMSDRCRALHNHNNELLGCNASEFSGRCIENPKKVYACEDVLPDMADECDKTLAYSGIDPAPGLVQTIDGKTCRKHKEEKKGVMLKKCEEAPGGYLNSEDCVPAANWAETVGNICSQFSARESSRGSVKLVNDNIYGCQKNTPSGFCNRSNIEWTSPGAGGVPVIKAAKCAVAETAPTQLNKLCSLVLDREKVVVGSNLIMGYRKATCEEKTLELTGLKFENKVLRSASVIAHRICRVAPRKK
jgi:hypothetical protein